VATTIFNDFSARDMQMAEMGGRLGPAKGKDFDTGNTMGPCLVNPDKIPDRYSLTMTARVNGEEWSRGCSGDILDLRRPHRLRLALRGAPSRRVFWLGHVFRPPGAWLRAGVLGRFLRAGDVVELEVERIGLLRNQAVVE
jgi:2-keto-4-pentenoate hydratase/2-oxohepta-3-ene-1,7-dioic acid hydratase in catechol pathway